MKFSTTPKLDETLDSGEVVLKAMPIATRNAFPPKTKFRLERYTTEDYTDTPRKWDLVVEHDDVEEYEGCPEICTHRVNLIEASVIAQGMHVDNIALQAVESIIIRGKRKCYFWQRPFRVHS